MTKCSATSLEKLTLAINLSKVHENAQRSVKIKKNKKAKSIHFDSGQRRWLNKKCNLKRHTKIMLTLTLTMVYANYYYLFFFSPL